MDFEALYCCVGLWSCFFTGLYSLLDVSGLMRWSTRSTEEIFALFISIAFCVDAFRDTVKSKLLKVFTLWELNHLLLEADHFPGFGSNKSTFSLHPYAVLTLVNIGSIIYSFVGGFKNM